MKSTIPNQSLEPGLQRILEGRHHDPFSVLGVHQHDGKRIVRAFLPLAESVSIEPGGLPMQRLEGTDLFVADVSELSLPDHYQFQWTDKQGKSGSTWDPYCFQPIIEDFDLYLFGEGKHWHIYNILGAHPQKLLTASAVLSFAVWAPNAGRVSVVGDFNQWDGRQPSYALQK